MGGADVARGGGWQEGGIAVEPGGGATIWPRVRLVLFVHRENCVRCTFVDFATCLRVRPLGPPLLLSKCRFFGSHLQKVPPPFCQPASQPAKRAG